MSEDLLARARESRKSPAALKVKVSNLRSRHSSGPIFVVEGVDDVGVYETWLQPFANGEFVNIVPGSGQEQLLGFRQVLKNDQTGLNKNVYFFVDKDYDGLQGNELGDDIFCTESYSVENYLGTILVCKSIIRDELRVDASSDLFAELVSLFDNALKSLLRELYHVNMYIYCCRVLGVRLNQNIPHLTDLVVVSLDGIRPLDDVANLIKEKLPASREITYVELQEISATFSSLNNVRAIRGKFIFQFFKKWFHCLSDEITLHPNGLFIKEKINAKFSPSIITHRSCAARSERPEGLADFAISAFCSSRSM